MTDHADTIREAIIEHRPTQYQALDALEHILAELRQAQEEAEECAKAAGRLAARAVSAEAQRQQAIDALREIADGRKQLEAQKIALAALVKLGEQP